MFNCTGCGVSKSETSFYRYKNRSGADRRRPRCIPCINQYNASWRALNSEAFKESISRWRKANPERRRESIKAWHKGNPHIKRASKMRRYAAKMSQTPAWADLRAIREFYRNCPEGYHVDHIIPLQGKNVRGLHTLDNLQYLTADENRRKSNKV